MAIGGPRLDRPSAIGDEGRPRTVSLWIASVVVVGIVGVAGLAIGQGSLLPSLGTLVGLVVAGIGLVDRERFAAVLSGYVVFVLFAALLAMTLLALVVRGEFGVAITGLAVALLGIGAAWANVQATEGGRHVVVGTVVAYVVMLVSLGLFLVVVIVLVAGEAVLSWTTEGASPVAGLAWFVLVVGYAAGALRVAQWRLPVEQLTPRDRRPAVRARLETIGRVTLLTALASLAVLVLVGVGWNQGVFDRLSTAAPGVSAGLDALAAPPLLGSIAAVGTVALVASIAAALLRTATRRFDSASLRRTAAAGAGVCLAFLLVTAVATAFVLPSLDSFATAMVSLGALLLMPVVLAAVVALGLLGVHLGIVPDRSGAPAVAAAGLVVAAVGFGGGPPVLVFACVAGAAVVWDVSWFGLGLTAELGHVPETRRLELFHGVVVVGIGAVTVALLTGLDLVRTSVFGGTGGALPLFVAGIGVLLLLLPLRG